MSVRKSADSRRFEMHEFSGQFIPIGDLVYFNEDPSAIYKISEGGRCAICDHPTKCSDFSNGGHTFYPWCLSGQRKDHRYVFLKKL